MDRFDSVTFAVFFAAVVGVYYFLRERLQWKWLLFASILFYVVNCLHDPFVLAAPLLIILVSFFAALFLEKPSPKRSVVFTLAMACNILLLVFFKYVSFLITSAMQFTGWFASEHAAHLHPVLFSVAVPLGISYISFQAMGYLIEVNQGGLKAEKQLDVFAGYLLFFPKIMSGPVERARYFLPQVKPVTFDYANVTSGIRLFGWGLFKKIVIADRLGLYVNHVHADLPANTGYALWIAALLFPLQLYADFSGYTDMALGLARILGFDLQPNFNQPFSSRSLVELWRRWHISLSTWFNDYFYTPLVLKRRDWGRWSVVYASMLTFIVLGLWHGPNWTYVVFGAIQGCFIAIELFSSKTRKRWRKKISPLTNDGLGWMYCMIVFMLSCIFLRSASVSNALYFFKHLFSFEDGGTSIKSAVLNHGMSPVDFVVAALALGFVFWVEAKNGLHKMMQLPAWGRWMLYYVFLIVLVAYRVPSASAFIYQQF